MPADTNFNTLGLGQMAKGQGAKLEILNQNQLLTVADGQSFSKRLDQAISDKQIDSARRSAPAPERSERKAESKSDQGGNSLPQPESRETSRDRKPVEQARSNHARQDQERVDDDRTQVQAQRSEEPSSANSSQRDNAVKATEEQHTRDTQNNNNSLTSEEKATETVPFSEQEKLAAAELMQDKQLENHQALSLEQALQAIETQLVNESQEGEKTHQDGAIISELAQSAESISPAEGHVEAFVTAHISEDVTPEEITASTKDLISMLTALNDKFAIGAEPEHAEEIASGDMALSIEQKLQAALGVEGVASEASPVDPALLSEAEGVAAASVEVADVEMDVDIAEFDDATILDIAAKLQLKGVISQDVALDESNVEPLRRVLAQLQRVANTYQSAPLAQSQVQSQDAAVDTDMLKNDLDLLGLKENKFFEKLNVKNGELTLLADSNLKAAAKELEGILQQRVSGAVEQLRTSTGESARSESSQSRSTQSIQATSFTSAFGKASEANANQAAAKTFSMTMQNQLGKPAWASEVGQRLMLMIGQKIQVAEIRLDPPDLGPLEVKVKMQHEQASIVFNTQHGAVKDAIEQAMPRLKEMFEQNGLSLGDVDVQDQSMQGREGESDDGTGSMQMAEEDGVEAEEQVVVSQSDRLVDYYA